jgi:hypothetical protein
LLHIATVHYKSPRWVEVQARYLREQLSVPYQVWTSLEDIDPSYASHFDHVFEQRGPHAEKLNHLAIEISHTASDDDLLMFLDGDAFPVVDPMPLIAEGLERAPLIAVRRAENANDPQPHPCFCVTTVGTWRKLPGDWSSGYTWTGVKGTPVSDVGANLLRTLELTDTPWVQLRRSHGTLHPLFFAVYAGTVYHHGGGFRADVAISRQDHELLPAGFPAPAIPGVRQLMKLVNGRRRHLWAQRTREQYSGRSELLFERISQGGWDWERELSPIPAAASQTTSSGGSAQR